MSISPVPHSRPCPVWRWSSLALLLAAMAGCAPIPAPSPSRQLTARTQEAVLPFSFGASERLPAAEVARIHRFLDPFGLRSTDRLVVSVPTAGKPGATARRRQALVAVFASYAAELHLIQDAAQAPSNSGLIRVVRPIGIANTCAPQSAGCATATNLAQMMAEPADLFLPGFGRSYHPASSGPEAAP